MKKIPPLNSVKAFEVSARHKSFSKAAGELGVTQGAISKQIKILEEYLELKLFKRKHQHISLTKEGEIYFNDIRQAIESIEVATDKLTNKSSKAEYLRLNVIPSFCTRWLIPRMDDFKKKNPHISIILDTGDSANIDFDAMNTDIIIRASKAPPWKQYHYEQIMGEELLPVCSPKLKIIKPDDLIKYQLLQHTTRPDMWPEYLKDIGYEHIKVNHGLGFEHFFMLIQAAIDGIGVALIPRFLIKDELEKKQIVVPFKTDYQSPFHLYIICPKQKLNLRKVRLFKDWLLSQKK